MSTFSIATNDNNDMYLDADGNIAIVFDEDAVAQDCDHAVKTLLGELIYNSDIGVPYMQVVFVGNPNLTQFESSLRNAILNANSDVVQVLSVTINRSGNVLNYSAEIESVYGQVFLNGSINNGV